MGGSTQVRRDDGSGGAGEAGHARDARGLQGFGEGQIRQDGGESPGQHRLPRPRRPSIRRFGSERLHSLRHGLDRSGPLIAAAVVTTPLPTSALVRPTSGRSTWRRTRSATGLETLSRSASPCVGEDAVLTRRVARSQGGAHRWAGIHLTS
jgi:hypothetical protein